MSSDLGNGSPESIFEWTTDAACLRNLLGVAHRLKSPDPVIFHEYRRLYAIRHALRSRVGALKPKFNPRPLLMELDAILLDLPSGELAPAEAAERLKWRVCGAKYHCEMAVAYPCAAHMARRSHAPSRPRPNNVVHQAGGSNAKRSSRMPDCQAVTMGVILLFLVAGVVAIVYWGWKHHTEAVKGVRNNSSTSDLTAPGYTDSGSNVRPYNVSGYIRTSKYAASDHVSISDYPGSYHVSDPDSAGGYYVYYLPDNFKRGKPYYPTFVHHTVNCGYYVFYTADESGYYTVMHNPGTGGYYLYTPDISRDSAHYSVACCTGTPEVDDPDLKNRVM